MDKLSKKAKLHNVLNMYERLSPSIRREQGVEDPRVSQPQSRMSISEPDSSPEHSHASLQVPDPIFVTDGSFQNDDEDEEILKYLEVDPLDNLEFEEVGDLKEQLEIKVLRTDPTQPRRLSMHKESQYEQSSSRKVSSSSEAETCPRAAAIQVVQASDKERPSVTNVPRKTVDPRNRRQSTGFSFNQARRVTCIAQATQAAMIKASLGDKKGTTYYQTRQTLKPEQKLSGEDMEAIRNLKTSLIDYIQKGQFEQEEPEVKEKEEKDQAVSKVKEALAKGVRKAMRRARRKKAKEHGVDLDVEGSVSSADHRAHGEGTLVVRQTTFDQKQQEMLGTPKSSPRSPAHSHKSRSSLPKSPRNLKKEKKRQQDEMLMKLKQIKTEEPASDKQEQTRQNWQKLQSLLTGITARNIHLRKQQMVRQHDKFIN